MKKIMFLAISMLIGLHSMSSVQAMQSAKGLELPNEILFRTFGHVNEQTIESKIRVLLNLRKVCCLWNTLLHHKQFLANFFKNIVINELHEKQREAVAKFLAHALSDIQINKAERILLKELCAHLACGVLAVGRFFGWQGTLLPVKHLVDKSYVLLFQLCSQGSAGVELLLALGADPTAYISDGNIITTPETIYGKNFLCLENSHQPDDSDRLLHVAVRSGQPFAIRALLAHGATAAQDANGDDPLHEAVKSNQLDCVKELLRHGTNKDALNKEGNSALHIAAEKGNVEILKLLLAEGADKEASNHAGNDPLHEAVSKGQLQAINVLLDNGVNIRAKNSNGYEPLRVAIAKGNLEVIQLLLSRGAEKQAVDSSGCTLLHTAAWCGKRDVIKFFLRQGFDKNALTIHGTNAIHEAIAGGTKEVAEVVALLLEKGVNKEAADSKGHRPLHCAAIFRYPAVVRLLLEENVSIDARTNRGYTALHEAVLIANLSKAYEEVAVLLLENGIDKDARCNNGQTALHIAAKNGKKTMCCILLGAGIDKDLRDNANATALDLAIANGHTDIEQLLRSYRRNQEKNKVGI